MIKKHILNTEITNALYRKYNHLIEKKGCYHNVFRVHVETKHKFLSSEWRIAYGYLQLIHGQPMFGRHAFIVDRDGKAIDPTAVVIAEHLNKPLDVEVEYYSFKIFDSLDEYYDLIENNDNMPDLIEPLSGIEQEFSQPWAAENSFFLIT